MQVTANNIANVDTEGYSRQRLNTQTAGMNQKGTFLGLGVSVTTVERLRNEMNDALTNKTRQDLGSMTYKHQIYERLQSSMTTDSDGDLDIKISELFDSFSELASDPQDSSVRSNLISNAQALADKFADISQSIEDAGVLIEDTAVGTVTQINSLLSDIHSLNQTFTGSLGVDHGSADMRVQKLQELAELVDFQQETDPNGAIQIRIGGLIVLDENGPETLKTQINAAEDVLNVRLNNGKILDINGGELGGQMDLFEKELPEMMNKLDELAATFVDEFNAIHSSGFGVDDATSRSFFNPSGTTASTISINQVLIDNPNHIAASSVASEAGNSDIAAQIADLRGQQLIGGRNLVNSSISIISTPGTQMSSLLDQIETKDAELLMLETQQERQSGVNIDEELALMIQYQNSYQAASRIFTTAQDMYDTLLNTVR